MASQSHNEDIFQILPKLPDQLIHLPSRILCISWMADISTWNCFFRISSWNVHSINYMKNDKSIEANKCRICLYQSILVFKIRSLCHARNLWKMPHSCKELRILCPTDLWKFGSPKYFQGNHEGWSSIKWDLTTCHDFWIDFSTELILGLGPANERQRYFVTMSLIGWAQA